jgi:hypothetical protein
MAKPLYKVIGDRIIDDMMLAGISVLVLAFGINYFNLKNAWGEAFSALSGASNVHFVEGSLILRSISNTFPFSLLAGDFGNFFVAIVIGLAMTALGFMFKLMTTKTKEKFIEDLGRELSIPAVLGFLGIVFLHVVTAIVLQDKVTDSLSLAARFNAGIFVWKSFGGLFLTGLTALVFGSLTLVIAKARHWEKLVVVGRTLMNSSYILIGYYLFVRVLAFDVVLESPFGAFMKIFIVSGDVSNAVIVFTVFMFFFGRELKRYGKYLRIKRKYAEKQDGLDMVRAYGARATGAVNPYHQPSYHHRR